MDNEVETVIAPDVPLVEVVDLSEWNSWMEGTTINWGQILQRVQQQTNPPFRGAILRASYGTSYVDHLLKYEGKAARQSGVPLGFYFYAHPTQSDPITSANQHVAFALDQINRYVGGVQANDLGVWVDLEENPMGWSPGQLIAFVVQATAALRVAIPHPSIPIGVYSYAAFYAANLSALGNLIPRWVASWGSQPVGFPSDVWVGWQYTDQGQLAGVQGAVDLSRFVASVFAGAEGSSFKAPTVQWTVQSDRITWSFPLPTNPVYAGWAQSVDTPANAPTFMGQDNVGYYLRSWLPSGTHRIVLTFFFGEPGAWVKVPVYSPVMEGPGSTGNTGGGSSNPSTQVTTQTTLQQIETDLEQALTDVQTLKQQQSRSS